jgi:hypothetical protein
VLLTDGKANVCTSQPPFNENCPDSPENCCDAQAAADAIQAAEKARADGITIYVIGFADQSIIGEYEDTLREIAKHRDETSPENDYCNDEEYCGKYYFAGDEDVLEQIYEIIAGEIMEAFGSLNIEVLLPEGMQLLDEANPGRSGVWNDSAGDWLEVEIPLVNPLEDLVWDSETRTISLPEEKSVHFIGDDWFAMQFDVLIPCDGAYCETNYLLFPPQPTIITELSTGDQINWGEKNEEEYCVPGAGTCKDRYIQVPFKYRDLEVNFRTGFAGAEGVSLYMEIANIGYKDADLRSPEAPLPMEFEEFETGTVLVPDCSGPRCSINGFENDSLAADVTVSSLNLSNMLLCKTLPDSSECQTEATNYEDTGLEIQDVFVPPAETIIARMNPAGTIKECSLNNEAWIYCGLPEFKFYTIDYYVWVK